MSSRVKKRNRMKKLILQAPMMTLQKRQRKLNQNLMSVLRNRSLRLNFHFSLKRKSQINCFLKHLWSIYNLCSSRKTIWCITLNEGQRREGIILCLRIRLKIISLKKYRCSMMWRQLVLHEIHQQLLINLNRLRQDKVFQLPYLL